MAESRIKVARDKTDLLKALAASDNITGVFPTYVDVLVFAAALGVKRHKRVPFEEVSKTIDPIRREYFDSHKCRLLVNLLSICDIKDQNILADDEQADNQRTKIFEEYANGGLEILEHELRGAVDYLERILLIISIDRFKQNQNREEFDLSKFLT
ncbi:DNA phosphorothioation-associated protein 4 [Merismopedia glauca]|uniref:DNA phosphorothioation-associated protein 4 n=1 Tax=Merismopedia glauca CCAP 1448/3 TaxID=1296344 RepID=A0A2T1C2W2_9CYAN|nr:DNA phosphorothioation-associated protein 4 [Merismopedia glauca]PSB02518.1 DNA phosphorothioation-associated protein 4 [Merismopedia glauca CCAP 1448/3]